MFALLCPTPESVLPARIIGLGLAPGPDEAIPENFAMIA